MSAVIHSVSSIQSPPNSHIGRFAAGKSHLDLAYTEIWNVPKASENYEHSLNVWSSFDHD